MAQIPYRTKPPLHKGFTCWIAGDEKNCSDRIFPSIEAGSQYPIPQIALFEEWGLEP